MTANQEDAPMFGRKKKSLAQPAKAKGWEHYNVTVSGFGTLGSEKASEVINKMDRAGWDLVSQSSSEAKYGQMINLVFRRPNEPGAPKPPVDPVVAQRAGCCLFIAMMPFVLGTMVAVLRRPRRGDG